MLGKVIAQHAARLAASPAGLRLVPLYLCLLRQPAREALVEQLLETATEQADDEGCEALYVQLDAVLAGWRVRQARLDELVMEQGRLPGPWWFVDVQQDGRASRQQQPCDGNNSAGTDADADMSDGGADGAVRGDGGSCQEPRSCLFGDLRCVLLLESRSVRVSVCLYVSVCVCV